MQRSLPQYVFWSALAFATMAMLFDLVLSGRWPMAEDNQLAVWDFATIWAAANRVLEGQALLVYDHAAHDLYYAQLLGQPPENTLAFGYPPSALVLFWPLGTLPYGTAMATFIALSLVAWIISLNAITRDKALAIAMSLAFGGATQTIVLGQSGFVTAALLTAGLLSLRERPVVGGLMLGLLALKPHLAFAAWLLMLLTRNWTALGTAVTLQLLLAGLATLAFGWDIWPTYFHAATALTESVAARSHEVIQFMMQSSLALALHWTEPEPALAIHVLIGVIALAGFLFVIMRDVRHQTKAAATIALTMLLTPYSFLYDATMLIAAAGLLLAGERRSGETSLVLVAVLLPGVWYLTRIPFVSLSAGIMLSICVAEARRLTRGIQSSPAPATR